MPSAVNMSLYLLDLLPISPLDGGQIHPATRKAIERHGERLTRRLNPGPVGADIVNSVRLFG